MSRKTVLATAQVADSFVSAHRAMKARFVADATG